MVALTTEANKEASPPAEKPAAPCGCTQGCTHKDKVESTPETVPARAPSGFAAQVGEWAHKRRGFFTSLPGEILFRNISKVLVSTIPAAAAFTATRYGFKAFNGASFKSSVAKTIQSFTKNALVFQTGFIFSGFYTFRVACKVWQRNYDRLFSKCDDASKASATVSNLPGNIVSDLKEILPAELPATAIASFPLGAIKMGLKTPEAPGALEAGGFAQANKGFVNEWLATVPALTVFTETTERIYHRITNGKDSIDYYDNLRGKATDDRAAGDGKKSYEFFTKDGLGRLVFCRAVSMTLGIAPYIALQRYSKAHFGEVNLEKNGFLKNVAKEYGSFAGFASFTAISELYTKAYNKLFERLEEKERQKLKQL